MQKEAVINRNFIMVFFSTLFCSICSYILTSTLPSYVQLSGGGTILAGLSTTAITFGCLVMRPFAGSVVDRYGRKLPLIIGSLGWFIVAVCLIFLPPVWAILALRFASGLLYSFFTTGAGAAATDFIPKHRLLEGIGYFSIATTISSAIGPAIGNLVAERSGYPAPFIAAAITAGAGFVIISILYVVCKPVSFWENKTSLNNTEKPVLQPISTTSKYMVALLVFSLFMVLASQSGVMAFLSSYTQQKGLGGSGAFFTVFAGAIILSRVFLKKAQLTFGTNLVVFGGLGFFLCAFLFIFFANSLSMLYVAAVCLGFGIGMVQPMVNTAVVEILGPARRGVASTLNYVAIDLGLGIGALLWGTVAQIWDFAQVYLLSAGFILLSAAAFTCFSLLRTKAEKLHTLPQDMDV